MKAEYRPYTPAEDNIILDVYDAVYTGVRDNAAIACLRIRNELGIVRGHGAVKSRLQRLRAHLRTYGRVIYSSR